MCPAPLLRGLVDRNAFTTRRTEESIDDLKPCEHVQVATMCTATADGADQLSRRSVDVCNSNGPDQSTTIITDRVGLLVANVDHQAATAIHAQRVVGE